MSSRVQLQPRVLVSVVEASLSARSAASTTASPISAYVEVEIPTFAQTRRTQAVPHTATPNWEHDQPDKSALMFAFPRTDDRISPATLSVVIRFAVYDEARVDAAGRRICYGKVDYALEQAVLTTVFDHTVALSQPTDAPPAPPSQLRFVVAFLDLKPLGDMHALHARRRREEGRQLESATRRIAGLEERARAFASDNDELKRHLAAAQLLSKEQSKELATLRGGGAAAGSSSSVSSAAAVAVETSSTSSAARVAQVEAEVIAHQLKLRETIKMLRKSLLHNAELKEMRRDLGAEVHQLRAELAESQRRALQLENERIEGRDGMSFARLEDLGLGHIAAELAEFIRAAERLGFDHAAADRLRGGVDGAMANPPLMDHSRAAGSAAKSAAEAALTTPRETVVVVKKLQTLTARVEQHGGDSEFAAASLQQMVERLNGELLPLLRECGGCMKDEDVALLLEMSVRDPHDQALRTRLVRKSSAVLRDWMAQKGDADAAEVRLRSCRANDAQGSDIFLASDSHRKFIDRLAKLVSSAKREVDVRTQRRMETERELNLISSGARNKVAAWKKSIFASMAAEDEARSQRLRQQREIRDTVRGIEGELEKAREGYQQHCLVEKRAIEEHSGAMRGVLQRELARVQQHKAVLDSFRLRRNALGKARRNKLFDEASLTGAALRQSSRDGGEDGSKMTKHRAHAAMRIIQDVVSSSDSLLRSHDEDEFRTWSMKRLSTRDRFRAACDTYIGDLERWIGQLERKADDRHLISYLKEDLAWCTRTMGAIVAMEDGR